MKKIFAAVISLVLVFAAVLPPSAALATYNNETEVTKKLDSKEYYMISLDDGSVMFSKNENKSVPPAAISKRPF